MSTLRSSLAAANARHRRPTLIATLVLSATIIASSGCGSTHGATLASLGPALTFTTPITVASAPQISTLTNAGTNIVGISSISITGTNSSNFTETSTCGATLAPGATCAIAVTFLSSTVGNSTALLVVNDNAVGNTQSVALSGAATAATPTISLSPSSITFPSLTAGSTSSAQTVTLTDTSTSAVNISGIAITGTNPGNFTETNTCGATLAPGAACAIAVTFTSNAAGSRSALLNVSDNAVGGSQTVALSGTATAPVPTVSLSATSITFPAITSGSTNGAPQTVTLTDTGTSTVNLSGVSISGANAGNFTQTNNCGASLASGATCTIAVTFTSSTAGNSSALLTITDNATGGSQTVALNGTATALTPTVSLSAPSITFPALTAGTVSGAQTVTLTNTGAASLSLSSITISGAGANFFSETTTCGATLAIGASCNVSATFSPNTPGSYTASINLTDNAGNSPQSIPLTATATPAAFTINTTNPADWQISNGTLTLDWNSQNGRIFGIHLTGYPDNLVDTTNGLEGIYMDNSGFGTGATTASYTNAGSYLDWSLSTASNSANAYTYTEHFVITPNDPGIHVYFVANHATTDIAGGIGQVQWVYRSNLNDFTNTYTVNGDLSNPGPVIIPLPPAADNFSTDPGRAVENATVDLHGFTLPTGYTREFYTKYDYSSYNYLHQAHGTFGSTYGVWAYFPSNESLVGGPTKQNLIYTGNLLILEAFSNHYDNNLSLNTPSGTASSRLFGPFYIHFNTLGQAYNTTGNTLHTPADMYQDALQSGASFVPFYDTEQQLLASGYTPSTGRGTVSVQINGVTGAAHTSWAVLSDPNTNFEFSSQGHQYWVDISSTGSTTFTGVIPGTYRLSTYVLGQWGELRQDNIVVNANQTTTVPTVTWVPENFGVTTPVFTIGTADRSAHEFLHGQDASGHDDREYWGAWNYWADFQANQGAVIYNATAGPAGAATNDLTKWNYTHWGTFDPGLFGGVFSASDDTIDGYKYVVPGYVTSVAEKTPNWQVHFATPATQTGSTASSYVVLSTALACAEGSYIVTLNGQQLIWHEANPSDCMVRSGLSAYTQWIAFQWDATTLNPPGQDNILTINVSQPNGVSDDALRLELTNTTADPAVRGWNDYEYIYKTTDTKANDAVPNP